MTNILIRNLTIGALAIVFAAFSTDNVSRHPHVAFKKSDIDIIRKMGLSLDNPYYYEALRYSCFYYGDGGTDVSFSDKFFERYKKKGFTVDTLCLGLQASMSFDAETGRAFPQYYYRGPELPLALTAPVCFKSGQPLRDCDLHYNLETGAELTSTQISGLHDLDRLLAHAVDWAQKNLGYCGRANRCDLTLGDNSDNGLRIISSNNPFALLDAVGKAGGPASLDDAVNLMRATGYFISYLYFDPKLPRGYGILLNADGAAGGGVPSAIAVAHAADAVSERPQLSAEDIAKLLDQ